MVIFLKETEQYLLKEFYTINILASYILFHAYLFFEDDNFGLDNMAYDESRDENWRNVVADMNEHLELQDVGNGEDHANINDDLG